MTFKHDTGNLNDKNTTGLNTFSYAVISKIASIIQAMQLTYTSSPAKTLNVDINTDALWLIQFQDNSVLLKKVVCFY